MSNHSIKFSDKENVTRDLSGINRGKSILGDENKTGASADKNSVARLKADGIQRKKSIGRVPLGDRVPLGGKDRNIAVPTLSRSQSTLDRSEFTQSNNPRLKRLPTSSTAKFPNLTRSSSSLGFIHQPRPKETDEIKLKHNKNTIFNPTRANRSPDLMQEDVDTDSLRKQIIQGSRGKSLSIDSSLTDTFTDSTSKLSSEHVPRRRLVNVDPMKKGSHKADNNTSLNKYLQEPSRYKLYQSLINDENSIEQGPVPVPKNDHIPIDGLLPLTEDDLDLFRNRSRKLRTPNQTSEGNQDDDNIQLNFDDIDLEDLEMNDVEKAEESDKELGLNEQDLNELLDF